jgi:SAM-dependent methyltransferase
VSGNAEWDVVATSWEQGTGADALRAYSDAVNTVLLERWLPERIGTALKTDLFDEAKGEGLVGLLLARAERVVGVDVSPAIVREAGWRNPGLEAVVADVRRLPIGTGSIDAVVSNSTLDHFEAREDIERALAELARVLRPGGLLVVTLDNAANPLIWLRNRLPYELLHRVGLVPYPVGRTLGPRGLRGAVVRAGLAVEQTAVIAHVPRLLVRALELRSRHLLRAEIAGAAPTRALTGQFAAVLARSPAASAAGGGRHRRAPRSRMPALVERALGSTVVRRS